MEVCSSRKQKTRQERVIGGQDTRKKAGEGPPPMEHKCRANDNDDLQEEVDGAVE